jgi:hypothetical protein
VSLLEPSHLICSHRTWHCWHWIHMPVAPKIWHRLTGSRVSLWASQFWKTHDASYITPTHYWFSSWAQGYNLLMMLSEYNLRYCYTSSQNCSFQRLQTWDRCNIVRRHFVEKSHKVCAINSTLSSISYFSILSCTEGLNIRENYKQQIFQSTIPVPYVGRDTSTAYITPWISVFFQL